MSRYEVKHEDKGLAYGHDHATGDFLMIWVRPKDPKARVEQDQFGPDAEEVIVDEDELFTKFRAEKTKDIIEPHGFQLKELDLRFFATSRNYCFRLAHRLRGE